MPLIIDDKGKNVEVQRGSAAASAPAKTEQKSTPASTAPRTGTKYSPKGQMLERQRQQKQQQQPFSLNTNQSSKATTGVNKQLQQATVNATTPSPAKQKRNDEFLTTAINEYAAGNNSFASQIDGTEYAKAVADLQRMYANGERVKADVSDGKVTYVSDQGDARIFFNFDEDGNRVKAYNDKYNSLNREDMFSMMTNIENYLDGGEYSADENAKIIQSIQNYGNYFKDGFIDDEEFQTSDGKTVKASEYMNQLLGAVNNAGDILDFDNFFRNADSGGKFNLDDVYRMMDRAQGKIDTSANAKQTQYWQAVMDALTEMRIPANRNQYNDLMERKKTIEQNMKQAQNAAASAALGTEWSQFNGVFGDELEAIKGEQATADKAYKRLYDQFTSIEQEMAQLNADYEEWNMTPEVQAAIERLSQGGRAPYKDMVTDDVGATELRNMDQALVDQFHEDLGLDREFYTGWDKVKGFVSSKIKGTKAAFGNVASLGMRLAGESILNPLENGEMPELGEDAILPQRPVNQKEYDALEQQYNDLLKQRNELERSDPAGLNTEVRDQLTALNQKIADAKQKMDNFEFGEMETYDPGAEMAQSLVDAGNDLNKWSRDNYDEARKLMDQVKNGMGEGGKFLVDLGSTMADIGLDTISHAGLVSMALRVLGNSAMDAQEIAEASGLDISTVQQLFYGGINASIEVLTEKLGGALGFAYGKGFTDDWIEKAIQDVASSNAGANFLRLVAGFVSEGGEEVISDFFSPFAEKVINSDAKYDAPEMQELLRDFLLGGAAGLFGEVQKAASGGYKQANDEQLSSMMDRVRASYGRGESLTPEVVRDSMNLESRLVNAAGGQYENPDGTGLRAEAPAPEVQEEGEEVAQEPAGVNGAVIIDKNGAVRVVKGDHRHEKAVNNIVQGIDEVKYGDVPTQDEAYDVAAAGGEKRPTAEGSSGNAPDIAEDESNIPPDNTKGGDALTEQEDILTEEEKAQKAQQTYEQDKQAVADTIDELLEKGEKDVKGNILIGTSPTSRDSEFRSDTDILEAGDDARPIGRAVLDDMKNATQQKPIYAVKGGKVFRYDGVSLTFITNGKDGNPKVVTVGPNDVIRQAKYLQGVYLAETKDGLSGYHVLSPGDYGVFDPKASSRIVKWAEDALSKMGVGSSTAPTVEFLENEHANHWKGTATSQVAQKKAEPVTATETSRSEEQTSTPTETAPSPQESVKPSKETTEQTPEATDKVVGLLSKENDGSKNSVGWTKEELDWVKKYDATSIDQKWAKENAAKGLATVYYIADSYMHDGTTYVYDGETLYSIDDRNGELSKNTSGVGFFRWLDSGTVRRNLESYQPYAVSVDAVKRIQKRTVDEYNKSNEAYTPTKEESLRAIQEAKKERLWGGAPRWNTLFLQALELASPEHPLEVTEGNSKFSFDGTVLREFGAKTGMEFPDGRYPLRSVEGVSRLYDKLGKGFVTTDKAKIAAIYSKFIEEAKTLSSGQQSGTINAERSEQNDSLESGSVPGSDTGTNSGVGPNVEEGSSSRLQELYEDSKGDAADHKDLRAAKAPVLKKEDVQPEVQSLADWAEEQTGEKCLLHDARDSEDVNAGTCFPAGEGISVAAINPRARRTDSGIVGGAGTSIVHETAHKKFQQLGEKASEVLNNAYQKIRATDEQIDLTYAKICWAYGRYYAQTKGDLSQVTSDEWNAMSPVERKAAIDALPEDVRDYVNDKLAEESLAFFISRDAQLGMYNGTYTIVDASREAAIEAGIFTEKALDNIDSKMQEANLVSLLQSQHAMQEKVNQQAAELEAQRQTAEPAVQEEPAQKTERGRTPGTNKVRKSAHEQQIADKGLRQGTEENMGKSIFTSRTNADRSTTANHLIEQNGIDAETERLLKDGIRNDDDVVLAQKILFEKTKAIRDYQMGRGSKLNKEGFRHLTETYNQLLELHKQALSEAGQKLQANYEFSIADKIIMKAAHTFLGFTEDGRFAGASPHAKNAKIYRAMEDAAGRITKAVDANDAQALAQICKDISVIRNVKKMFGPLGNFASKMETKVLEKIATEKNGVKTLEALAYGNLNAITDDVQPYKVLNAAKTIRVMNMLSNMATIINNVGNNAMQGLTNSNFIGQGATQLASKAFEKLTGSPVVSKSQRGWVANKEIRTAELEMLEMATLSQMYGITVENGRLELNDRGMFNANINPFEQTMSFYKFLIGMGVEATDQVKAAGLLKSMEMGIDADIAAGKINTKERETRMKEAQHEVNRLLYKDDNAFTARVQMIRDGLNKLASVGNEKTGTVGLGDITMAFAKIPANVVKTRLSMTPEGALYNIVSYARGVHKAKRMHSETLARGILEDAELNQQTKELNQQLDEAYQMPRGEEKTAKINEIKSKLQKIDSEKWARARTQCSGSVYKNLMEIRNNYGEGMTFDHAAERAGYDKAKEMSQFEMAQNARKIGRAATSAGMMALGAVLRGLGALKDFDEEPNDELRKMNSEKGYKGLMLNLFAMGRKNHEWKDGDTVLDAEWLECIALPLTIGATAAECAANAEDFKTWKFFKSVGLNGLGKAFESIGDIPGMSDAINLYDSFNNAYTNDYSEAASNLGSGILNYAANTVPSFFMPNAVSQAAAGVDNTMRDVYTADNAFEQAWNIFKNKIPVLRKTIPASVDVWGNERTYGEGRLGGFINKTLLPGDVYVFHQSKYEKELERLIKEGYKGAAPKTTTSGSFEVGDEKYTMTADEKREFKSNRNTAQAAAFEEFMDSDWYKQLNDAQRMKVFQSLKTSAERDAKQDMLRSRGLDVDVNRDKWETELTSVDDQIEFLAAKQMAEYVWDRDEKSVNNFKEMDDYLTKTYSKLSDTQRELLDSTYSHLDDMYEAKSEYGISSQMWQKAYDIYSDYNSDEGKARVEGGYKGWEATQMWTDIANATGATDKQMEFFEGNPEEGVKGHMMLYNHIAADSEKYHTLVDSGWDRDTSQNLVKNIADLEPTNGRKTVSYKQRLTTIATTPGSTDKQKWEAFYEYCPSNYTSVIKNMTRYRDMGYSYEQALKAAKKWDE